MISCMLLHLRGAGRALCLIVRAHWRTNLTRTFMLIRTLLLVIGLLSTASPAAAQKPPAGIHPAAAPSATSADSVRGLVRATRLTAGVPSVTFRTKDAAGEAVVAQQHAPRWARILTGAGIGAAIGGTAFLLQSNGCWRKTESMCELAIPLFIGAGATAGGVIGYLLGSRAP